MAPSRTEQKLLNQLEKLRADERSVRMSRDFFGAGPKNKSKLYNRRHMTRMQWMMMATPFFQAAAAVPIVYEDIMANKAAMDKLKKLGIGKADMRLAQKNIMKGLAGHWKLLALPALGALAVRKFRKPRADTSKGYVLRKGVSFKQ